MAEQPTATASTTTVSETSGGGSAWLAFLVGGLLVAVAIIAWYMMSGGQTQPSVKIPDSVDVHVSTPSAPAIPDAPSPAPRK